MGGCIFFCYNINFKLIHRVKEFNVFRAYMILIDVIMLPILLNITTTGVCKFKSDKLLIIPVKCYSGTNQFSEYIST